MAEGRESQNNAGRRSAVRGDTARSDATRRDATRNNAARRAAYLRKKKQEKKRKIAIAAFLLIIIAAVIIVISVSGHKNDNASNAQSAGATTEMQAGKAGAVDPGSASGDNLQEGILSGDNSTEDITPEETTPAEPYVVGTATIGATGDILTHNFVLDSAYDGFGNYDFTHHFTAIAPYWSALDYMIVNLEVPLSGSEGEKGSQYPTFDAPDSIVTDLKAAGVDMFLTATNHTNDCGGNGIVHTQELINSLGLDHIGTRLNPSEDFYKIKNINGIRFGMTCYTYDTRKELEDPLSLNGIPLGDDYRELVNTFCYSDPGLELMYSQVESDMKAMEAAGCDVKVVFMHWGTEYMDAPSDFIRGFAQKLSDLGADLIIGGHPHVIQPFEVLQGKGGNTTYCLYSTGNCLSSQRKEVMNEDDYRGYTEDGLTISFTYEKLSSGQTSLKGVYVLPTWVDGSDFTIVPLDADVDPAAWYTYYTYDAIDSYNRTEGRVGSEYAKLRERLEQPEVPESLG